MFSLAQVPGDMQQCDDARKCICKRGCDAFETERETAVDGQVLPENKISTSFLFVMPLVSGMGRSCGCFPNQSMV